MDEISKEVIKNWFQRLQQNITDGLEKLDGKAFFKEDLWERAEGGGGSTRTIISGDLIEKGGVNYSAVYGVTPQKILKALHLPKADFFASGVSIVLHPFNPWVPIIHMNIRYFEMSNGVWWFGGGIDLTPHIIIDSKAKAFHNSLKKICDQYSTDYYPEFKKNADDYFYISHRNETRGIGGIFFDKLMSNELFDKTNRWLFVKSVGQAFVPIYTEAVSELRNKPWTKRDKEWQKIRRGRYTEFNLVYDKGTKFGLDTNGRIESILMSLPPEAQWQYNHKPQNLCYNSTLEKLKKRIDWV